MSSIGDLPDVAMLTIFDNLPLLDLLHIDEVCTKWENLKSSAFIRRKHLYIVPYAEALASLENPECSFGMLQLAKNHDGSPSYPGKVRLDRHAFYTRIITHQMLDKIIEMMPNLKVIRILQWFNNMNELWKLKFLLHNYRKSLVSLTLWFWSNDGEYEDPSEDNNILIHRDEDIKASFTSLFHTLNGLKALKSLELNVQAPSYMKLRVPLNLTIASQLKLFNIRTFFFWNEVDSDSLAIMDTLLKHAEQSEQLEEVVLHNQIEQKNALSFGPRLSSAFKELRLNDTISKENLKEFKKVAQQFVNVKDLSICLGNVSASSIAKALSPLKNLIHLSMSIHGPFVADKDAEELSLPSVTALR